MPSRRMQNQRRTEQSQRCRGWQAWIAWHRSRACARLVAERRLHGDELGRRTRPGCHAGVCAPLLRAQACTIDHCITLMDDADRYGARAQSPTATPDCWSATNARPGATRCRKANRRRHLELGQDGGYVGGGSAVVACRLQIQRPPNWDCKLRPWVKSGVRRQIRRRRHAQVGPTRVAAKAEPEQHVLFAALLAVSSLLRSMGLVPGRRSDRPRGRHRVTSHGAGRAGKPGACRPLSRGTSQLAIMTGDTAVEA